MAETYPGSLRGLKNVVVEFREANGTLLRSTRTNTSGDFQLDPGGRQGYIRIAPGRNQVAWPSRIAVKAGDRADFRLMGMPGQIEVRGNPGSFVLITTGPWEGASPARYVGNPSPVRAYSGTIGTSRARSEVATVTLAVPRGNYYLTCWSSEIIGGKWGYRRVPSAPLAPVEPQFPGTPASCH